MLSGGGFYCDHCRHVMVEALDLNFVHGSGGPVNERTRRAAGHLGGELTGPKSSGETE